MVLGRLSLGYKPLASVKDWNSCICSHIRDGKDNSPFL